jgi:tetraacyldisaccharide 4'-kinase
MKAPNFWFQAPSLISFLLKPFSWIYEQIHKIRWRITTPAKSKIPIICVGNPGVGGSGKTPVSLSIGIILKSIGFKIAYLTRGYGGKAQGPIVVSKSCHTAHQVGDEPLLLTKCAKTVMAKNRLKGLKLFDSKTDIILMDDGYQNPTIQKDINLLVIDGPRGFGNGCVFPGGPLREPLDMCLHRASLIVVLGQPTTQVKKALQKVKCPIFYGHLKINLPKTIKGSLYAFAGIAFPEKFFDSLRNEKCALLKTAEFPDHYPYKLSDLEALKEEAGSHKAQLVTTEKDYYRIPKNQRNSIIPIPVMIEWEDEAALTAYLKKNLI